MNVNHLSNCQFVQTDDAYIVLQFVGKLWFNKINKPILAETKYVLFINNGLYDIAIARQLNCDRTSVYRVLR